MNDSRQAARMGRQTVLLRPGLVRDIYGADEISERHGNRYEVDASITDTLTEKGLRFTGFSAEGHFPEVFEMQDHPFYVGVIYHPEFISRPNKAHPLFVSFLGAALK